ncbi:SprT-like domain-containing protein [Rubritalea sp.]|uniref:SprT-like domain-containing protein n=1 Tax=Rubritalea sp. TaxID=2109375 RepID=UPI003EF6FFA5
MEEIKAALSDILESSLARLEELAGSKFAGQVSVVWNKRMRSTAGRAFWPECRVELNPKLVEVSLDEVRRTLLHELAHLLAYYRCGRRRIAPHGAEWQQACADLGIPGESVRHTLPLPRRAQQKKWRYTCPSCQESIERVRKMKRHVACYSCCQKLNGGRYHKRFELIGESLV